MSSRRFSPVIGLLLMALALPGVAVADGPVNEGICEPEGKEIDPYRQLRALSLQLRGVVPSLEDYAVVDMYGEVPSDLIDEWLGSDAFADRVVRLHRDLLWNNIQNVNLFSARSGLTRTRTASTAEYRYYRRQQGIRYRGDLVPCLDQPAEWDSEGNIVTYSQPDGTNLEGWVQVTPYWDKTSTINVCAFDAQDTLVSPAGVDCASNDGYEDLSCGCGPDLAWCRYGVDTRNAPVEAMSQDVDRRIKDNITTDASYIDIFTGNVAWVNGPLVHYLKYQTGIPANVRLTPDPYDDLELPELAWEDTDTWLPLELGPEHAGILTSPGFLLRFQTNRARANRFYSAFMCQPFQPPDGGIPATDPEIVPSLDLQLRDGCKYCHALLEPAASHWARWTESGAGFLEEDGFPAFNDDCERCATSDEVCSQECNRYYVTSAVTAEETEWFGWLKSYEFRRAEHMSFPAEGPSRLVLQSTVDARFPECVAGTAATWLLGRPVGPEEQEWIEELAMTFTSSGWSYRELVRAIVTSDTWGRVQ
ncbi:MAG: DUF1585 domain-containing protein [Deltaproteobacteria bacterium]|nr:DUF1585 domain-containing protein [Deltaproteobacteria bacterium]